MDSSYIISKLKNDLVNSEDHIQYLEKILIGNKIELKELRHKVKDLQLCIEKLIEEADIKENYINHIETQFSNERTVSENEISDLQEEILLLKNSISNLEIDSNNQSMAQPNIDPIDNIINNHLPGIAGRLHHIQRHIEGHRTLNLDTLNRHFEGITGFLTQITQNARPLQGILLQSDNLINQNNNFQRQLDNENERAIAAEREVGVLKTQLWHTDQMLTNALNDERRERQRWYAIAQNLDTAMINALAHIRRSLELVQIKIFIKFNYFSKIYITQI